MAVHGVMERRVYLRIVCTFMSRLSRPRRMTHLVTIPVCNIDCSNDRANDLTENQLCAEMSKTVTD